MTNGLRRFAVCGALAAVVVLPARARADSIDGPPACPPGARGESSHAGQWCVPWLCAVDADCGGSGSCRDWRVCTRESDVIPGGLRPEPEPAERIRLVVGTCDPAAACRGDEEPPPELVGKLVEGAPECKVDNHCVPADLPGLPARTEGVATPPVGAAVPVGSGPAPVSVAEKATPAGCGCAASEAATGGWLMFVAVWFARRRRR